ncbi:FtsH protease activity modulator HflK [Borreliella burgdorferi]|uniref:FtsH protease activity modulator HflK n=1 Tax=Borreliella burgdorferi TaxID=139 RepID=UPI00016B2DE8|nr:FtsH protease activity modulator HflK [Borreliella burgdorferi]EEF83142.1 HflK protein [Borreliella burgdorferi CA-11.2A]EEH31463.1 HflK protein [Borreliella burgdorferi Bol26]MCD2386840.1 FtsH protease activity modulator HflK [Borreliella burgdorferi]MCD2390828.1 FtsH protease activity modulator HflK [Borreliella burgdorferi]MCD2416967.1 FtsH protease activity modulator HflK [Borreliella burgdorferi]
MFNIKQIFNKTYEYLIIIITLILISIIVIANIFIVGPSEEAIVLRLGKLNRTLDSGIHVKIPLIEEKFIVPVKIVQEIKFGFLISPSDIRENDNANDESRIITGDLNIINIEWLVQYKIRDPYSFKFKVEDPETTIKDIAKSSMNRLIGDNTIFEIINDNRVGITEGVKSSMNEIIDNYNLGIDVVQVQIRNALPPKGKVYEAFEDVNIAIQDKNKYINEGRKEFNQIVPKIKGEALKVIEEARGYKESRINNALADTEIFNAILDAYLKNPDITKERLYNETMKEILENKDNIELIDKNFKNFLPFKEVK